MATDYDTIAADYKRAKQQPWRYFVERYTFLRLIGRVEGLSVLDLACGEGYYTCELAHRGAARVVGVDYSEGMIHLARVQERRAPLGIAYEIHDARTLTALGSSIWWWRRIFSTTPRAARNCSRCARRLPAPCGQAGAS